MEGTESGAITDETVKQYEAALGSDEAALAAYYHNDKKPAGYGGRVMLHRMNRKHSTLSVWGLAHLPHTPATRVLDVGCGGGANLTRLLAMCPDGHVAGIDHSPLAAEKCAAEHADAIRAGRCRVCAADVCALPFGDGEFDAVTAFETVYFWPDVDAAFREVARVLCPGGCFLVCHECDGTDTAMKEKWERIIPGLRMYRCEEVQAFYQRAGFVNITTDTDKEKGWFVLVGTKPATPSPH